MDVTDDGLLDGRLRLRQPRVGYRAGVDAALLAAAKLPDPEPVPTVTYRSGGRVLVVGPLDAAERAGALLQDTLDVTLFAHGGAASQERRFPVLAGRIDSLTGWLGGELVDRGPALDGPGHPPGHR